jgi:hypothetical protein
MTVSSSSSKKITVIAEKKIGKFKPDDEISIEKYAARVLVALGKARFKDEADEFRKPATVQKKRGRQQYRTRDMTAQ